jgi:hypothetical protein
MRCSELGTESTREFSFEVHGTWMRDIIRENSVFVGILRLESSYSSLTFEWNPVSALVGPEMSSTNNQ